MIRAQSKKWKFLAGKLADMLPSVVDRFTMYGQIPEGELLAQRLSIVKGDAAW